MRNVLTSRVCLALDKNGEGRLPVTTGGEHRGHRDRCTPWTQYVKRDIRNTE